MVLLPHETNKGMKTLHSQSIKEVRKNQCCFWIFKLLYLDFQILLPTEIVTRLSHDQVALFKTFRGTAQNARQNINHAASNKTNLATTVRLTTAL